MPSCSIVRSLAAVAVTLSLGLGLSARPASASEDFIVFLRDGSVREVTVLDFDERTLRYEDLGPEATLPIADVLALVQGRDGKLARVARQPILRRTRGMVELRTGERIPGLLGATPPSDPERFSWIQTPLGDMEIALEDVAEIIFLMENDPGPIELNDGDRVVLANGDRLDGFLDSVGIRIGVIRGEGDSEALIEVPVDRVAAIRLVADAASPGERRVWLADGTVVDVERVRVGGADGGVFVDGRKLGANLLPLSLNDVAAVLFDTRRLRPLSSIELERLEPLGTRYHVSPPTKQQPLAAAGLGVIELRGPLAATWVLPDGASRFAATAVLPAVARAWGDLELVVLDGREERFRVRIDGAHPVAEIDVPLSGAERRLTLRLEAGRYGPIMDRLELRLARVLVD